MQLQSDTANHIVTAQQFHNLFIHNTPFLDVRSEDEFAKGSLPNSHNHPILNNYERHQVGTCYKHKGKQPAVELGHKLVSGEIRQKRIEQWCNLARNKPEIHLFCWRGGMRSNLARQWISEAGIDVPLIEGGYKALRRYLMQVIDDVSNRLPLIRIGGKTGTAKTRLINEITPSIDLEKHAEHRGSSFGLTVNPQPSQSNFEHNVAIDLLQTIHGATKNVLFIEDESRNIGTIAIPEAFYQAMRRSPLALLDMPFEFRIQRILKEYITDMLTNFQALYSAQGFDIFENYLQQSLFRIHKRLGLERYRYIHELQSNALKTHRNTGRIDDHTAWISLLLTEYYDPMYDYQIKKNKAPVIFHGSYQEVSEWAMNLRKF